VDDLGGTGDAILGQIKLCHNALTSFIINFKVIPFPGIPFFAILSYTIYN